MAAKVTDRLREIGDILQMVEEWEVVNDVGASVAG
jgi:hypothetical protein